LACSGRLFGCSSADSRRRGSSTCCIKNQPVQRSFRVSRQHLRALLRIWPRRSTAAKRICTYTKKINHINPSHRYLTMSHATPVVILSIVAATFACRRVCGVVGLSQLMTLECVVGLSIISWDTIWPCLHA
jgi:hypothetical protein